MNFSNGLYALGLSLVLLSSSASATIYQLSMLRLDKISAEQPLLQNLTTYQGKPLLMSFFMPNCRWCHRQNQALKTMQQSCPKLQTIMLGVKGNKQALKKELKREKNTFPAYLANQAIVQAVGSNSPVPMMLIFDHTGQLVFKTSGFTPAEKLHQQFKQHQLSIC